MKQALLLFVIAILVVSCKDHVAETPAETTVTRKLNSYLTETVDRLKIAGLTVAITRNDSVIYTNAFGYRNIETKEPLTTGNIFHWASVSKTFVSTAIMQLWQQKKIDLDEKLITYVPYFKQAGPFYKEITIRQMLNHTSGIGDVDDYEWNKPQYDSGALERFVRSIANDKMLFTPGTDFQYSNSAYEALGDVIAKVSGMSFETYVRRNILDPLEMNTTSFLYQEIPDSLRVSGHLWLGGAVVSEHYPYNRMHGPSSTLNSNVLEMTHYAMAHLHRGIYKDKRILPDSIYDLWWKSSVDHLGKSHIGLTWFLEQRNGTRIVSHSGGDKGFRSMFMLVPDKNISVILVGNYEALRPYDLAAAMLDIVMDIEPLPGRRQIGFEVGEVMKAKGIDSAKAFFKKTKADSARRKYYLWREDEGAFGLPAYFFYDGEKYAEAVELFKLNVEEFPNSSDAQSLLKDAEAKLNK
ncbi:MAG: serine hydrolase domain-containing protein [Bacteroidota bacterium]